MNKSIKEIAPRVQEITEICFGEISVKGRNLIPRWVSKQMLKDKLIREYLKNFENKQLMKEARLNYIG